jgi:uridine kinase
MVLTDVKKQVMIVEGVYTPNEALQMVNSLLDAKIDFHNLRRLSDWVKDCNCDTKEPEQRISELRKEKELMRDIVRMAREADVKLQIHGALEITLIK